VAGFCKFGNEPSSFIKCKKFLEELSASQQGLPHRVSEWDSEVTSSYEQDLSVYSGGSG
jgi:hypothetical protein